jgi:hypothetical protein
MAKINQKEGELKEFEFYIDEKVITWNRHNYTVKARSLEEAKGIMLAEYVEPKYKGDSIVYNSLERLNIEQRIDQFLETAVSPITIKEMFHDVRVGSVVNCTRDIHTSYKL